MKIESKIQLIIRWIICFVGIWAIQTAVSAQISERGIPPSFKYQTILRSHVATVQIPVPFNVSDLIIEDERQAGPVMPLRIGTLIDVQYNPANAGVWHTLPDGTRIWQLHLQAKGAIDLSLYYADFYIPEGGKLFIYNAEKTHILGAYTHQTFPSGGRFANESVAGDELTLEYVATPSGAMPRIEIEAIGYGYNNLAVQNGTVSLRAAGSCEVNINCEEGDVWQNQKKGVCRIKAVIGSGEYTCSGSLVNNTAEDLKPYILTAYHNALDANDRVASTEDMKRWVFYFHDEREGCSNNSLPTDKKSMVGCSKIAATTINKESDGLLVLLNMPIPEDYNVYYNGWDRRNQPAQSGVSIHHPQGDYKKISTFYNTSANHWTWNYAGYTSDTNAHWNVTFDATLNGHGVTDGGSSGSPLFNEDKLIVGTLTGGNSSCSYPDGLNIYGKVSYHWDRYKNADSTRMDVWLDPIRSGVEFLAGRYHQSQMPAPSNINAVFQNMTVILTWDAPQSDKLLKYNIYNNNLRIGETTSLTFTDHTPQYGLQTYSVSAVYEDGEESIFTNVSLTVFEYTAPRNVSVIYTSAQQQVAIQWEPPVYEQTLFWGESNAMYQITLHRTIPFYFGQKWNKDDIKSFHKKTITAVQFYPVRNNAYDIYIVQGNRTYRQEVTQSIAGQTNSIPLATPFVIDSEEDLVVALYVKKHSTNANEYPAVCDDGPAVQGKGNLFSFDGLTWFYLHKDIQHPAEFDLNFFVAATVSSIEKEIPIVQLNSSDGSTNHNVATVDIFKTAIQNPVSLRSAYPATFPAAASYYIYRDNVRIATVPPMPQRYLDNTPSSETFYQVSAVYDGFEGQRSDPVYFVPVNNQSIESNDIGFYPSIFLNQLELSGYEYISKVEVFSATGRLALTINKPGRIIHTESLQPGVYFFRIYTINNEYKVMRGIKKR